MTQAPKNATAALLLFITRSGLERLVGRLAAIAILLGFTLNAAAQAPGIVQHDLGAVDFGLARDLLAEAISEEGLRDPTVSHFAEMLARTATDLGHSDSVYRSAQIFTFCSVAVAARLAAEAPENIALCPLSIAVYQPPRPDAHVTISYRLSGLDSDGGRMAEALLARIARRTIEKLDF